MTRVSACETFEPSKMIALRGASPPQAEFDPAWIDLAWAFARHFARQPEDAEDLAQEALLLLLRSRDRIFDPASWLYVVVRRLAARSSPTTRGTLPLERLAHDPWPAIELDLDARRLLASLPSRASRALRLSFAGLSERESAEKLGCSVRAVEKVLHTARKRVRMLRRTL